jgi:hypothetical protein
VARLRTRRATAASAAQTVSSVGSNGTTVCKGGSSGRPSLLKAANPRKAARNSVSGAVYASGKGYSLFELPGGMPLVAQLSTELAELPAHTLPGQRVSALLRGDSIESLLHQSESVQQLPTESAPYVDDDLVPLPGGDAFLSHGHSTSPVAGMKRGRCDYWGAAMRRRDDDHLRWHCFNEEREFD